MSNTSVKKHIQNLVVYALHKQLIEDEDCIYCANQIAAFFSYQPDTSWQFSNVTDAFYKDLHALINIAVKKNIIHDSANEKEQMDNRIMNILTPRPSAFIHHFQVLYSLNPQKATHYFYTMQCDCHYVQCDKTAKNIHWKYQCKYGNMDITINLSKPEISQKEIRERQKVKPATYPSDLLSHDNVGYAGSLTHPSRMTLRQLPLTLNNEKLYMQFSPYAYFNEHCIVLSKEVRPMKIEPATFRNLLSFLDIFPHYMIGSNSDLPICGGSILAHEHFQGGNYTFALMNAPVRTQICLPSFPTLQASIVEWPLSIIRLESADKEELLSACHKILFSWQNYTNERLMICSCKNGQMQSTLTPIAYIRNNRYIVDIALRNSLTTEKYPLGYFHSHPEYHHIKKENIGLIEVMGLAILPPRLQSEMEEVKKAILNHKDLKENAITRSHAKWVYEWLDNYPKLDNENIDTIIKKEIGRVFVCVLENCAVFKNDPAGQQAFQEFLSRI